MPRFLRAVQYDVSSVVAELLLVPQSEWMSRLVGTTAMHCTVTIPMVSAALGATLSVETLDGARDLDIRPGTQSGQVIPLYGLGVRHLNDSGRGDLVIHVTVETPAKLDEEQEALLKQLAKLRGEEAPPGRFAPGQQGFFHRLRDAFNGR